MLVGGLAKYVGKDEALQKRILDEMVAAYTFEMGIIMDLARNPDIAPSVRNRLYELMGKRFGDIVQLPVLTLLDLYWTPKK